MKNKIIKIIVLASALSLLATGLIACGGGNGETDDTGSTTAGESSATEETTDTSQTVSSTDESAASVAMPEPFDYSQGIDENGFWAGVTATDSVEPADYAKISVPLARHEVTGEQIQSEIDGYLASVMSTVEVTDRAIKDGDTVNIDYVGSIDGVEFQGGSTGGNGTEVTIGVTQYIDDFLEQLIGHNPGESFDIEVTFPDDYGNQELAGKDAVFAITVNHIVEHVTPELTDAFVAENFEALNGWKTVDEMKKGIHDRIQKSQLTAFLQEYLFEKSTFSQVPQEVLDYQENAMFSYFEMQAASYGMTLEQLISMAEAVETCEALKEKYLESNTKAAKHSLVIQAIAETEKVTVTDEDVALYFKESLGADSLDLYIQRYGENYLKQITMGRKVLELLLANVDLLNY